ncbi:YrzE family protein [Amycolatopsis mediterranei]|uniref:YrzE family protein n=1 Tax=Amycolatopsis mediterranei TaxID=33910 RepID=UPI0034355C0A
MKIQLFARDRRGSSQERNERDRFAVGLFVAAIFWGLLIAVAILLFTIKGIALRQIGLSLAICLASGSIGGIAGFIFGLPKSARKSKTGQVYEPNSNLEEVSDWLTKIIVGVGLVEIRKIAGSLWGISTQIGTYFDDPPGNPGSGATYAISLIVATFIIAFLQCYMWTRVKLFDVFSQGDPVRFEGAQSDSDSGRPSA